MQDPLIGTLFGGRFRLESLLGSGGMATVYLARHEVLGRRVAIKLLHRRLLADLNIMARFEREARAASRIEHPHITQIFDYGHSEDGVPYLAMEYVEGADLGRVLRSDGPFAVRRAVHVLSQIASALEAAHGANVVHRDLKPANVVLVCAEGQPDQVKVLDFGLAKILGPEDSGSLSTQGLTHGTPEYMSPEQISGEPMDHRTDLYSFGVLAFELLVGRPPFSGSMVDVMAAHLNETPPAPSEAAGREDLPAGLDRLVLRCLAKRPEERYADAAQLAGEIRRLTVG